ncbi:MATH domain and coiled-coil domain-containing protein At3g58210-like [Neltuma alba]|uniref:MATH domain and coiled-coil domain-containing protein At3g58210-like n=1 Tax=Neltuma alba TaxID=207710 RepID=UPI0010A4B6ED|nr:MATH domain and coiled-coil domain-containing protein At3g58210-like [Prosopis alba]
MTNQEPRDVTCKKVVWTINNFSTLRTNHQHHSEVFTMGRCAWKIALYRGRQDGKYLAIFLEVADLSALPHGWSISAAYTFTVVNQASIEKSERRAFYKKFCADSNSWGYPSFMDLATLQNPSNGYILNDICIVEVEFSEVSSEGTQIVGQIEKALVPKDDDAIEFKDLGQIEKALVPLLEEACLWHPSLMDYKQRRSRKCTEWAFTALGRVLQFLKNKKWKDMNEKACEQLQQLWEELEMSKLDLSWLEPLVKSAINMKGYADKVEKVKKLKQELVVLEIEMKKIKEKLVDTEQSAEMTRKELTNAEQDFEEKDLDANIGYGKTQSDSTNII